MKSIFNGLEKIILTLSIVCILFLIIIQFLSYDSNYTVYSSKINNKIKFIPFSNINGYEKGIVILKNLDSDYKEIEILLNGDFIDNFVENDEIRIDVYDNDIIEIDGTKYNKNLSVKVIGISNNIETPNLDTSITTSQSMEILSKVKLK